MGLVFSGASQSEDCDIGPIGMSALNPVESTRLGGLLMSGLRGKYEVSVAYFGSNELRRGRPLECRPVKYRIDTFYDAGKGAIEVMPGEVLTLDPWSVGRTAVSNVRLPNDASSAGDSLSGADIIGFSLNVGPTRPGCALIGSGSYLPEGGQLCHTDAVRADAELFEVRRQPGLQPALSRRPNAVPGRCHQVCDGRSNLGDGADASMAGCYSRCCGCDGWHRRFVLVRISAAGE